MSWRIVVIKNQAKLDYKMGYMVVRGLETKRVLLDEIGILLPIHEFEKKMLQHLDEIDGIVLACREKMMEKAGNDSLQL